VRARSLAWLCRLPCATCTCADWQSTIAYAAWEEAVDNLDGEIDDIPSLPLPTRSLISLAPPSSSTTTSSAPAPDAPAPDAAAPGAKRKAAAPTKGGKKAKLADGSASSSSLPPSSTPADAAPAAGGFESVFTSAMLLPPQLLSAKDVEKVLVERQKRLLLDEYGVDGEGEGEGEGA